MPGPCHLDEPLDVDCANYLNGYTKLTPDRQASKMTRCERVLLDAIRARGCTRSLFRLATELNMTTHWARRCLRTLEAQGLVHVERRGPGAALVMTPAAPPASSAPSAQRGPRG
jgi:predicted transcriptional regulator